MTNVVGVNFKEVGKVYTFDPGDLELVLNQKVIVETAKGVECGIVAKPNYTVEDETVAQPLKPVLRIATEEDLKTIEENRAKEKKAFAVCQEKIKKHNLDMKLIAVEYAFDRSKILFFFTADGRVDFRELVKDLASVFKTRIELRQIGVRDEAKLIGTLGVCGRPCCCKEHLTEFNPVSIKMAKDQGLSLNPTKISGSCGRLMCCLQYEQNSYEYLLKITPRMGSIVDTREGRGVVVETNLISGNIKVRLDSNPDAVPTTFTRKQVKLVKDGKKNLSKTEKEALRNRNSNK